MCEMDDVVGEFLVEGYESLDQLDRDLVALEADPDSTETLASIFRTLHTIKGTCGFLGFTTLEGVTHVGENLLSRLRDGQLRLDAEMTTALLALSDALRSMLLNVEETGHDGPDDHRRLVATLTRLKDGVGQEPVVPLEEAAPTSKLGEILVQRGVATPGQVAGAVARQLAGDTRRLGEILVDLGVSAERVSDALDRQVEARSVTDNTIRIDVAVLDDLMALVEELASTSDVLVRRFRRGEDPVLDGALQRLGHISVELQGRAVAMRMQPIGTLWSRFPRVVRDVALACGKSVRLTMEGDDTELDKAIIEAIKDPLTHLVRNAIDHGVETPEVRAAAGKDPEGRLLLRASDAQGEVRIEIADDGAGIDLERIRAKAIERGLVAAVDVAAMSDLEVIELVFAPGLTTAETVTNVSGRGVGMDVVRTSIDRIGGTVTVDSEPGTGTSFTITVPPTAASLAEPPASSGPAAACRRILGEVDPRDVVRMVRDVWGATLGLVVEPAGETAVIGPSVTAVTHISGAVDALLSLECSRDLGERAAALMLGLDRQVELRPGDVEDALGELMNMAAGGLKSLLAADTALSLPTVVAGTRYRLDVPGTTPAREVWLSCGGSPMIVRVHERARALAP